MSSNQQLLQPEAASSITAPLGLYSSPGGGLPYKKDRGTPRKF